MKTALITGQDGYFLAELLLPKDCEVHGIVRAVGGSGGGIPGAFSRGLRAGQ
jgi:hypothetical protein